MSFFEQLDNYGEKIALIDEQGVKYSYAEMLSRGDDVAHAVGKRCVVFIICRNCVDSVCAYVGFMRHQIIPVLINDGIGEELLANLIESYHPMYFYLPADRARAMNGEIVLRTSEYALLRLPFEQDYHLAPELALLLTTSGSTGSPKLVRQSIINLESNTRSIAEYLQIQDTDRAITTMPMSYTYGMSILNTHLLQGASIVLTEKTLLNREFWQLLQEQQANNFGGVPYIYEILKKLRFENMNLPSLRYITQAGGKLSKELCLEFANICENKGIKMFVMYGATEATSRMSYLPWEYAKTKAGSIGVAIPGGCFNIIDENNNLIETPDTAGELVYSGDNVTLGYATSRSDLIRGDDNGGVLNTGDMAIRDEDGFYYIVGRKKRFLKLFGNRVNLDEVEGLLKKQGFDCACTGSDDNLKVFVTAKDQISLAKTFLVNHTGITPGGIHVMLIDAIPRNDSGKVLYSALEEEKR